MSQRSAAGVIGLGHIGDGVSRSLGACGFQTWGYDVRAEAALELTNVIRSASSPAEVARRAEVVLIAVLDDEQVRDVLVGTGGLLTAPERTRTVVLLSTTTLETVRWAARECEQRGVALMDCGVSGGRGGFEARAITAMVGGDADAFERARPLLETFANPVLHMGALGRGMAAKLARNVRVYTDWAPSRGKPPGWRRRPALTWPSSSRPWKRAIGMWMGTWLWWGGDLDSGTRRPRYAAIAVYAHKDLAAAIELGEELSVAMPAARLALSRVAAFPADTPASADASW